MTLSIYSRFQGEASRVSSLTNQLAGVGVDAEDVAGGEAEGDAGGVEEPHRLTKSTASAGIFCENGAFRLHGFVLIFFF